MTNKKVISVLAIVAVAAMMGAASIAPAYAGVDFAKNAVRAPFVDTKVAGGLDITGTCVANVDRDGNLHLRMIGHGFVPDSTVFFGTQLGGGITSGTANDTGDVNFSVVIENWSHAEFDCVIGLHPSVGGIQAKAHIDISA
jgi:hypothetical protein